MDKIQFKQELKRVYEFARLKVALRFGLLVLPLIAISCLTCGEKLAPVLIGLLLLLTVVAFKWRGLEYGKSVTPGLVAGTIAFSVPLVLHLLEICCRNNLEIVFCMISGAFGGFVLGRLLPAKSKHRVKTLVLAIFVSGLTAALGCASLGAGAVAGLFLPFVIAFLSAILLQKRNLRSQ